MLTTNPALELALSGYTTKPEWLAGIKAAFGATRRVVCTHEGTIFRDCALSGDMLDDGLGLTHVGIVSGTTVSTAADLSIGIASMRIEGNGYAVEGSLGLTGSGADFELSANPTETNGLALDSIYIAAPSQLPDTAPGVPGDEITTFSIDSATTTASAPFTYGHVFSEGDVPDGYFLDSDLDDWQAVPTTYWPDGSLRHAIISGRASVVSGSQKSISLFANTAARTGAALTEADLASALPVTVLSCGAEDITLGDLVGTAALHRTVCAGPVMSNWLYRKQLDGSDHLVAWFDVRLYKGGSVEIFPWIENGYLLVANPANDIRTYTFTIGGITRFSQELDVKHHTRIPLITGTAFSYWVGADPELVPRHSSTYMMATKMVPNYGWAPTSTDIDSTPSEYPQEYTPNWIGSTKAAMATAGFGSHIGPLPHWAAGFVAGGDPRAYAATIYNGMAAGAWPTHYRDEGTNEVIKYSDHPTIGFFFGGTPAIPAGTGGVNQKAGINAVPDMAHQTSMGYVPWLVTGRWFFLEEHLFWVSWNYMTFSYATREQAKSIYLNNEIRARGWSMRSLAQAFAIIPESHPCYADIKLAWESNTEAYEALYVTGTKSSGTLVNNIGWMGVYSANGGSLYNSSTSSGYWWDAPWQQGNLCLAFALAWDMNLPQSAQSKASHQAVRNHAYKLSIGLAGDGSEGTFNYRRFAQYVLPVGTPNTGLPPTAWTEDFGTLYALVESLGNGGNAPWNPLPDDDNIYYGNTSLVQWATGSDNIYHRCALALATDQGVPGAAEAYARVVGAPNWDTSGFSATPIWGIIPRSIT